MDVRDLLAQGCGGSSTGSKITLGIKSKVNLSAVQIKQEFFSFIQHKYHHDKNKFWNVYSWAFLDMTAKAENNTKALAIQKLKRENKQIKTFCVPQVITNLKDHKQRKLAKKPRKMETRGR